MIKSLLLLTATVLVNSQVLKEPHPDCLQTAAHFLLPHEYDCTKFYYCEWGEKFILPRNCPPGTEFSAFLQVCTHPFAANCNLPGYPVEVQTTPAATPAPTPPVTAPPTTPEPITEPETTPASTPAPTTPEPITEPETTPAATPAPTTPEPITEPKTTPAATPAPTPPPTTPELITEPLSTTDSTTETTTDSTTEFITDTTFLPTRAPTTTTTRGSISIIDNTPPPSTTELHPGELEETTTEYNTGTTDCERFENGCPVDFSINQLLPHETFCRYYYHCVHGNKVLRKCPRQTYFNMTLQVCDHISNLDGSCEDDVSSEEKPTTPEEDDYDIIWNENGCPAFATVEWLLPHSYYCNKYYQCVFGERVPRLCPTGTYFNPDTQLCDHIFNVNCSLPGGVFVPPPTTEAVPTQRPTLPPIDFDDKGCPINQSITWMVPHPQNCSKFFYCVWGELVEMNCTAGLHFSLVMQRCENPATAGCAQGPCSGVDKPCNNDTDDSDSVEPPPVDDDNDYEGDVTVPDDDGDNDGNVTVPDDDGNNDGDVTVPGDDGNNEGDVTVPDDNDDNDGNVTEPDDDGGNDGNVTVSDNDDSTCGIGTGCGDDDENDDSNVNTTQSPYCEDNNEHCISDEDLKCIHHCNHFPWAHKDCDKFWVCKGIEAVLVTCTNGLYFNSITGTCDFACNVDCDSGKVRITQANDGLKLHIPWNKLDKNARQLLKLIDN